MKFKVTVNGRLKKPIGLAGPGVVSVFLTRVQGQPQNGKASRDEIFLSMHALDTKRGNKHSRRTLIDLKHGDVVRIQIVDEKVSGRQSEKR
jgi:hypothetical protein